MLCFASGFLLSHCEHVHKLLVQPANGKFSSYPLQVRKQLYLLNVNNFFNLDFKNYSCLYWFLSEIYQSSNDLWRMQLFPFMELNKSMIFNLVRIQRGNGMKIFSFKFKRHVYVWPKTNVEIFSIHKIELVTLR